MTITVLIDDSRSPEGLSFWFDAPERVIATSDPGGVASSLAEMEAALDAGAYLAGFFAYELGYLFEPRLRPLLPRTRHTPLLWFGVFDAPLELANTEIDGRLRNGQSADCGISEPLFTMGREDYRARFGRVKKYIAAGDIYQLNLTFKARFAFEGSPRALYADLRAKQPVGYGALIEAPDFAVISASPELFLERGTDNVLTRPMKGTAKRGLTLEQDRAMRHWLQADPKSRAENLMIVDLMRNDLGRVAETGSVTVSDIFTVEPYATLHQMTSGVRARLRPDVALDTLIKSIFPPGSVTGAPKLRAMEIIAELEGEPRGVYTGAVGMFAPNGCARLNVAIRTLTLDTGGRGEIGIGSGIVQDSEADDEYDECLLKLRFLREPVRTFELIETLRHDPGEGYYLLERHLERLSDSAAYFGYSFDQQAIAARLQAKAQTFGSNCQRVRLLLSPHGSASISSIAIDGPAEPAAMSFVLSGQRTDTDDVFLYHKTTRRELYDGEHARLTQHYSCDEVLFLNERGELAEGSRTNIFVKRGGMLLTPALSCGLLPGTLRAELLASGEATEAILYPSHLETADEVFLGNSVRGLVPARPVKMTLNQVAGGG